MRLNWCGVVVLRNVGRVVVRAPGRGWEEEGRWWVVEKGVVEGGVSEGPSVDGVG